MAGAHLALAGGLLALAWLLSRRGSRRVVKQIPAGSSLASSDPEQFSIVSYNVLADTYASGAAGASKMSYASQLVRSWAHRWPLLRKSLKKLSADVICLQEVDVDR